MKLDNLLVQIFSKGATPPMLIRETMETIKFSPAAPEVVEYRLRFPEVLDEKTMQEIAAET